MFYLIHSKDTLFLAKKLKLGSDLAKAGPAALTAAPQGISASNRVTKIKASNRGGPAQGGAGPGWAGLVFFRCIY